MNRRTHEQDIAESYELARGAYAEFGVDTDEVLSTLAGIPISLHCWQGDDVTGFEPGTGGLSGGGILTTGNQPGRARNGPELRQDLDLALDLIPGRHRVNIHALYAETGGRTIGRDTLTVEDFRPWLDWAKAKGIGLDFNPSFFSHDLAASGYTLASRDEKVRRFWVEHGKRGREIAAAIGRELHAPCVNNLWIPDGAKDDPADRIGPRRILLGSLDEIYAERFDGSCLIDTVESKLFGIGSESYVVGSHEFYLGYALNRNLWPCLDLGHFHPTENVADKISALLLFADGLLVHASRGIRWDSDHVVVLSDGLLAVAEEVRRCRAFDRVRFALDYFDASINRVIAWVAGARATLRAILAALLEPVDLLVAAEESGDLGQRLALREEFKALPGGAVWNQYCVNMGVPPGPRWLERISEYEGRVLARRS